MFLSSSCLLISAVVSMTSGASTEPQQGTGYLHFPAGEHRISAPIIISENGFVLEGPGKIVQTDPAQPVVRITNCRDVRISGVTLTRADGAQSTTEPALRAEQVSGLSVDGIRIHDNHSQSAAIRLEHCERTTISNSEILNYKTVGIDDRTTSPLYGYAFHCVDGTGIIADHCVHTSLLHNRIIEERLLPTREAKEQHKLGSLTDGRMPLNPGELARGVAARGYVDNWHQGSAVVVTGPTTSRHVLIQGNLIINAAQAIDMHCDYANVANNLIENCMIGIKGTHGSHGVVVSGNTITGADLWGMVFNPGAGSHEDAPAAADGDARPYNADGGLVITGNLISGYGYGNDYWNWGGREAGAPSSYAIAFLTGQLPSNPPLSNVLLQGNAVLSGKNDTAPDVAPRYRLAVYLEGWDGADRDNPTAAQAPISHGNLFQPGLQGISNVPDFR